MLDMYREEALTARQERAYGDMLHVRPYLLKCWPILLFVIAALLAALLLRGQHMRSVRLAVTPSAGAKLPGAGLVLDLSQRSSQLHAGQPAILYVNKGGATSSIHGRLAMVTALPAGPACKEGACFGADRPGRVLFVPDLSDIKSLPGMPLSADGLNLQVEVGKQGFGGWLIKLVRHRTGKDK